VAFFDFGFVEEFFVTGVAKVFGVVFFLLAAVRASFYHHAKKKRSHVIYFVQTY
jgi:hypothetical protein